MKKTFLAVLLSVAALASLFCLPVFSSSATEQYETIKGGTLYADAEDEAAVKANINDVFGDKNDPGKSYANVKIEGSEIQITLKESVNIASPIVIKGGKYRINGQDCKLFRGFSDGSLIVLDGSAGGSPSLTVSETKKKDWTDSENDTAILTLDGNKENFPSASGALVSVRGNASLELNGKVALLNAVNTELGGALYAEAVSDENGGYLSPSVKLSGCKISNCSSLKGGGAVALIGGKNGEGAVALTDVIMKKNTALNDSQGALGGAVYTSGGSLKLSEGCQLLENSADIGGGMYICGSAEISDTVAKYNSAKKDGGALYCGTDSERGTAAKVTVTELTASYNTADGNGGAIANGGTLIIGGSNTYFEFNEAKKDGGCVYNCGSFGFTDGGMSYNKAGGRAGAVYNTEGGILNISGGRISTNEAALCGGVYSAGAFSFKGGSIGKSQGSEPQNLISGVMKMSGSATFTSGEVLGLLIGDDGSYTVISIDGELTSSVQQSVAFFKAEVDVNGDITSVKLANKNGNTVFSSEDQKYLESAVERFDVYVSGIKKNKLKADGTLGFKMPLMPIWGWMLSLLGAGGAAFGAVLLVKRLKKRKAVKESFVEGAEEDGGRAHDGDD